MVESKSSKRTTFYLPPKGALETTGPDDPLKFYYHPIVGFLYRTRIQQALSLLSPPYESILEIGYGSGIMMPTLVSIGKKVSGVDIHSNPDVVMRNLGKIRVNVSLKHGDVCNTDFPSESFDLVVAVSVLEHLNNLEHVVKKVFYLLRPGGHFLVGMPSTVGFMECAFGVLGYNAKKHHITDYKYLITLSSSFFRLDCLKRIPPWSSVLGGLYFNMLFCKRAVKEA